MERPWEVRKLTNDLLRALVCCLNKGSFKYLSDKRAVGKNRHCEPYSKLQIATETSPANDGRYTTYKEGLQSQAFK